MRHLFQIVGSFPTLTQRVAMHLTCGGIFHYKFAEFGDERILKIGQQRAKLWARVGCPVF